LGLSQASVYEELHLSQYLFAAVLPLKAGLSDRNQLVRRRCVAALAELVFYLSTSESQAGPPSTWPMAADIVRDVARLLKPEEDVATRHYAAKAIDNIMTLNGFWAEHFMVAEAASGLIEVRPLLARCGAPSPNNFSTCSFVLACRGAHSAISARNPASGYRGHA
jgi:hypothetical protein